VNSFPSQFNY